MAVVPEKEIPDFFRFHPALVETGNDRVDIFYLLPYIRPELRAVKVDVSQNCLKGVPDLVV